MFNSIVAICLLCAVPGVDRDVPQRVVQGEVRCRVLLIDFEGREHVHSQADFQKMLFGNRVQVTPGRFKQPTSGSARDFFHDISGGKLHLTGQVMPWVRSRLKVEDLPHWRKTKDGNHDWWQPVVADAMSLNHIPKDDRINGKPVDFYAIIYAGPIDGYFKCLKQRQGMGAGMRYMSKGIFRKTKVPYWEDQWQGKKIIFCPERWKEKPSGIFGIGLVLHEMGHAIGHFTDLYVEPNGDFGRWAIMGLGEKTHFPTGPTAFHRYMAGWLTYDVPRQEGTHRLRLPPLQAKRAVKLVNGPMPWADALIVEHRARLSPYQKTLPDEGLLVYEAYGRRQLRTVEWNKKDKKAVVTKRNIRIVRADDKVADQPGDVFRKGDLSLFGKPSSASSATGCGFWELSQIHVPARPNETRSPVSPMNRVATFNAKYRPRLVDVRRPGAAVNLGPWLPPGDYRFYIEVGKGSCSVVGDNTLLRVTVPGRARSQWGLVDVHVSEKRRRLAIVPDAGSQLASAQVVDRRPVLLDLLAEPYGQQLASGLQGKITTSAPLAKNVCVGGAITIPLEKSASASVQATCPGGLLRLALKASLPRRHGKKDDVKLTLTIRNGNDKRKYLDKVTLSDTQPEFFVIDCKDLRSKSIRLDFHIDGPSGSQVVLWEAAFVAP